MARAMSRAEREREAVAGYDCPRYRCWAKPGQPCRYLRGVFSTWQTRELKHPHAERVALVTGLDKLAEVIARMALITFGTDGELERWASEFAGAQAGDRP